LDVFTALAKSIKKSCELGMSGLDDVPHAFSGFLYACTASTKDLSTVVQTLDPK
jgi:hypothetical protein